MCLIIVITIVNIIFLSWWAKKHYKLLLIDNMNAVKLKVIE